MFYLIALIYLHTYSLTQAVRHFSDEHCIAGRPLMVFFINFLQYCASARDQPVTIMFLKTGYRDNTVNLNFKIIYDFIDTSF